MARAEDTEVIDLFEEFYRNYYRNEIGELAQKYPNEQKSLYVDWQDLYRFDPDLADDYRNHPGQFQDYAEEALRLYDLPVDVKLGQAHVRVQNLPKTTGIRDIRADHRGKLIAVTGIVRKATDVRPKVTTAAFECQRCGTLTRIPQTAGDFQEPHECQGCERQGPFRINYDQSEFVDAQKLRIQESPEGLRGGETPQSIDVNIEDDITGRVTAGDHVRVSGELNLDQQGGQQEKSPMFDVYMDGSAVTIEDEQFEDMDITDEDKKEIVSLSEEAGIYETMVDSIAPSIYGYRQAKLAIILQLFSGVTKHLPDESRIRGDLHMLLIGDPGTGKCVRGDTKITLADGSERPIRDLVEENLDDPVPVDDGVYDEVDIEVPSLRDDGKIGLGCATRVWKREAPDRMYRVRTASGYELEVTPSHPLFVQSGGGLDARRADSLTEGQFVATPRELPTEGDDALGADYRRSRPNSTVRLDLPETWTPWLARLLGYIVAEGYVEQREDDTGLVSITDDDHEVLDDVADTLERLGLNYTERGAHDGKSAREIACFSSEFVRFLQRLDANILGASTEECVPAEIMGASRRTKSAFLRAFIEGEGHVSATQREITVASMSRDRLEHIRSLLLTLGITSQLTERHNDRYRLRISGTQFERYVQRIGFVTERTSSATGSSNGTIENTDRDIVPEIGDDLARVREALDLTQADCGLPRSTYQRYERGDRNPSRASLQTVVDAFEARLADSVGQSHFIADGGGTGIEGDVSALRSLATGDVLWDKIESIEETEPEYDWVYDLEIEGTHSYISNNVVSHNSQLLQYVREIAPRSVYTSGKGSSSAGLTAAAVRDDFGDGQQWTLEAGALVLADQGIAAVDELDKMAADDRSAMHEALEQQSYHPKSDILLADGRRVEIGEFVDGKMAARSDDVVDGVDCELLPVVGVGVHSVDLDTNGVEKTTVDRVSRHEAPDEFVRVTFSNGRNVLVTPEHPMFVDDGGEVGTVEAGSIEEGAFVPAPRKLPNSADPVELDSELQQGEQKDVDLPDELSPDLAELLGLLAAEGHSDAGSAHEIGFSNSDERLPVRAADLMCDVFGMECTDTTNAVGTATERWGSTKLIRWFEENFPAVMHTARDRRIPAAVLGASEEEIRRFLVGAFAGDGGAERESLSFSTASEGLARDYADALSKIGVASRVHHDSVEDPWTVYVMDDSIEKFVDRVVESTDDRYDDARALANRSEETPRHRDVLPTSAAREIRELRSLLGLRLTGRFRANLDQDSGVQIETVMSELAALRERAATLRRELSDAETLAAVRETVGWSCRELGERIDETANVITDAENGGYDEKRRVSLAAEARDAVEDALAEFERRSDALEQRCDLRYYRVTDVETVPNEGEYACDWVYDVTVEPTNTFVSEGVVLHNSISVSKAGINATLKSRCSLLGAANPKYGRFDQYEPIAEQIDLEPALVSRFDLIFTVTDKPDEEADRNLAKHILTTNYAGELNTHRAETQASDYTEEEVARVTDEVSPEIDAELLRKYVAYAKRNVFPTMTEEAKAEIREFYVDLRSQGTDEDAPVPVTARKLEALVRLAEASARIRLSDTVEVDDAQRVIEIVQRTLEDIGMDPETGELDADVIETGTSKSQRDRIKNLKTLIADIEDEYDEGAPVERVLERAEEAGMERSKAEHEIEKLKQKGEVYEPRNDHLRTT